MSHDTLVYIAKTYGLMGLTGFFLIVVVLAYRPSARAGHDRAARSILPPEPEDKA